MFKKSRQFYHLILTITLLSFFLITASTLSFATRFSDLENHWAKSYVETVSTYKAVNGYVDGTFKPDDTIQRIEFLAIVINAQGIVTRQPIDGEYWGMPFIEAAINSGLILPNEFGDLESLTFQKNISREEMANIVVNAYLLSGGLIDSSALTNAKQKLSDFDAVSPRYQENALASVALDFITGYSDGTFGPLKIASRAQAAVLSYKLLIKLGAITNLDLPENIVFSKKSIKQGDLLKFTLYHADSPTEISVVQDLYPNFKWVAGDGVFQGVLPTNYSTLPGSNTFKFVNNQTGNVTTKTVTILPRDFKVQKLTIDSTVASNTTSEEAYAEYRKYFNPSREISSPLKYYTEPFLLPVKGKLTTEFGESRTVNGALTSYRHAGIDIAAPRNANVLAANTGKVMLAMPLIITGNSIVIDHGEGIFSVYFHLDKLFVKQGELVNRGQLIGAVGSTGFSTGPHLHFTMSYYRFDIEPGYLLYGEAVTKNNYLQLLK